MDYLEQVTSIQYLVNSSQSADDARMKYAGMEGILLDQYTADRVFEDALQKKYTSKIAQEISALESRLKSQG